MDSSQLTGCTINLSQCSCFKKLNDEEIKLLNDNSVIVRYKKGEVICKQGSLVSQVLYMVKGLAKVYIENEDRSLILKMIPDESLFGLDSISEANNKIPYSVSAYIDSDVKQINLATFRTVLSQNAEFAMEIINILNSNNLQISGRFFCLTHKQSYGRLADTLLCFANRIFYSDSFDIPISRQDLADISGLSAETVVRMLKKFTQEGLLSINGKNFKILDLKKLEQISDKG